MNICTNTVTYNRVYIIHKNRLVSIYQNIRVLAALLNIIKRNKKKNGLGVIKVKVFFLFLWIGIHHFFYFFFFVIIIITRCCWLLRLNFLFFFATTSLYTTSLPLFDFNNPKPHHYPPPSTFVTYYILSVVMRDPQSTKKTLTKIF